jgi:hypothetical protein
MHPFAAGCPTCGADLDVVRRRKATAPSRTRVASPSVRRDVIELFMPAIVLVLLALYAPLYGALLSLFLVWHSHRNGLTARRNIAIACVALAIFDLLAPDAILPAITL